MKKVTESPWEENIPADTAAAAAAVWKINRLDCCKALVTVVCTCLVFLKRGQLASTQA